MEQDGSGLDELYVDALVVLAQDTLKELKAIIFNECVHVVQSKFLAVDTVLRNVADHFHDEVLIACRQFYLVLRYKHHQLDEFSTRAISQSVGGSLREVIGRVLFFHGVHLMNS